MKANFPVYAIVAIDDKRAIGKNGQLAWHIPEDLKYFSSLTKGHTVLMGRKTYQSLPDKFRPLPGRLNLVLSRAQNEIDGAHVFSDINSVIDFCNQPGNLKGECLWVIGGEKIYQQTENLWDKIYLTRVKGDYQGDVFLPDFENKFSLQQSQQAEHCIFETYVRKNS